MARQGGKTRVTSKARGGGDGSVETRTPTAAQNAVQGLAEAARSLIGEMSRKKPREAMLARYSELLQEGLTELRLASQRW